MNIAIFGAGGATGKLLVAQALDAGYDVSAVTRDPRNIPIVHDRLRVVKADVHEFVGVSNAMTGCEAVLSTLGLPFTRHPITVYSDGITNIMQAMRHHGITRLVAVSSSATYPHHHADGGFLLNVVMQPLVTATIGRTTYVDMRRMEEAIRRSDLAWTIVRPSGLFDLGDVTDYRLDENEAPGVFTSRADLAASMLAQLNSDQFVRKAVAVTTTQVKPNFLKMMLKEAFKKS
jgi:nucleoside-diphosphate-sugar epimerase